MKRIDCLATKEDVVQMKCEVKEVMEGVVNRLDALEGQLLDVESKASKTEKDVKVVQGSTSRLKANLNEHEIRIRQIEKDQNNLDQYSRRWNLRFYKVAEKTPETSADCAIKVTKIISELVQIPCTPDDFEAAHRVGRPDPSKPRPIIVRFFDRRKRDEVLANRRKLKNKGVAIDEDLTFKNYKVSKAASSNSMTMSVWSHNGKILAKVKNGKIVKLDIHSDINEELTKAMNGNVNGD
jgi:exosome complex exonuclease DIS3/RRP44